MGQKTRSFFLKILSSKEVESSRRFITLVIAGIFIITCLTSLLLLIFLFVSTNKLQNINIEALKLVTDLLKDIIKDEALIIFGGMGFVTAPDFAKILLAFFKKPEPFGYDPTMMGGQQPGTVEPQPPL